MNCKPGDLARIVRMPPEMGFNDKIVRLKDEPPIYIGSYAYWQVEGEMRIVSPTEYRDARGRLVLAGAVSTVNSLADDYLRPIRNPGDNAVDEMVRRVGSAPITATELLGWSEAA